MTTHTYEDRVNTVEVMKAHHISPCSGVICGMGETDEDIIDMAFALKEIDADSIPVNFLHPIKGTKFGGLDLLSPTKCLRILALFRLINPTKEIELRVVVKSIYVHFKQLHFKQLTLFCRRLSNRRTT